MREVFIDKVSMTKFGRFETEIRDLIINAGKGCLKESEKKTQKDEVHRSLILTVY